MKIISWNLNHRTNEKNIPKEVISFFKIYNPEIIVLNEFVDGISRDTFKRELQNLGYIYQCFSKKIPKHNQIFIASKYELSMAKSITPTLTSHAETNYLHVIIPSKDIELIGLRAPSYKTTKEKNAYWFEVGEILSKLRTKNIVLIGDINFNPFSKSSSDITEVDFIYDSFYKIKKPIGEWSYISPNGKNKSIIDHAIYSKHINIGTIKYLRHFNNIQLAGSAEEQAISDHAVLTLELE
jgi:exonuclease III